jgi:hypothetical protein
MSAFHAGDTWFNSGNPLQKLFDGKKGDSRFGCSSFAMGNFWSGSSLRSLPAFFYWEEDPQPLPWEFFRRPAKEERVRERNHQVPLPEKQLSRARARALAVRPHEEDLPTPPVVGIRVSKGGEGLATSHKVTRFSGLGGNPGLSMRFFNCSQKLSLPSKK